MNEQTCRNTCIGRKKDLRRSIITLRSRLNDFCSLCVEPPVLVTDHFLCLCLRALIPFLLPGPMLYGSLSVSILPRWCPNSACDCVCRIHVMVLASVNLHARAKFQSENCLAFPHPICPASSHAAQAQKSNSRRKTKKKFCQLLCPLP